MYYVRKCSAADSAQCNDQNDGQTPHTAWATLGWAASYVNNLQLGNVGDAVIVGPGTYAEGDVALKRSGDPRFPIQFRADPTGGCTGDPPGPVTVDVKGIECPPGSGFPCQTGFLVFGASYVVVDGFNITNADLAGVEVRPGPPPTFSESVGAIVANNTIYANGGSRLGRAVQVVDSEGTVVFNNLLYNNLTTAIGVLGSPDVRVINNTLYNNGGSGIVIAHDEASPVMTPPPPMRFSPGAWVINNIVDDSNTPDGFFSIDVDQNSRCDYIGAFNLLAASTVRSPSTPLDPSDLVGFDPHFIDPSHDNFSVAAGSPAIDAGAVSASVLDLNTSSTTGDGVADSGLVDLGFHAGHIGYPDLKNPPLTTKVLYVRTTGDDRYNDGSTPQQAFATISGALQWARAQTRIVVGPGTYRDNVQINGLRPGGPVEFFGDSTGQLTGDAPGLPLVDAGHAVAPTPGDGFNDVGRCSQIVDGVSVTNAHDPNSSTTGNGFYLKDAPRSIVRNTVTFSNSGLGINIEDSDNVQVINNLAYANGSMPLVGGGIQVGGAVGSNGAVVEFNTCYGNGVNGILIGTGQGPSTHAKVFYNIVSSNGQNGIQLGDNTTYQVDLPGYSEGYNLAFDNNYGAGLQRPTNDLLGFDPELVDPAGPDGILGGAGFADDDFHLSQITAGQTVTSLAVDFADIDATMAPVMGRTTRSDGVPDAANADLGFHYPAGPQYSTPTPSPGLPLVGDCNGDGRVTIAEVVTAVNIALGTESLSDCPAADTDGDGRVSIDELIQVVANALR